MVYMIKYTLKEQKCSSVYELVTLSEAHISILIIYMQRTSVKCRKSILRLLGALQGHKKDKER